MNVEMLLIIQALASLSLTGLIWTIQIVHYPLFALVGDEQFVDYEARHQKLISRVVVPLMLAELGVGIALLGSATPAALYPAAVTGAGLLAVIWLSTFFLSVPAHMKLARGFETAAHARLMATNWIRTAAWSLRGLLALWMLTHTPVPPA